ncbi:MULTISPECIES: hypothetical protein [unclassified Spirulina]|uniref:hypothetical protein n=1 Tax=unclassified Spirulina TaxID=2684457 RepID=UPI0019519EB6|nr:MULTISPECIES: hypothetical protein [Spirulina]MEA5470380.1 hypothetical protein [Spirulina sp. 06S082]
MVKYKVSLKIKDDPDAQEYPYILDLNLNQENNPKQIFTAEISQRMREILQNKSGCKIDTTNINRIISAWVEDIQEGYRDTIVILDLPLLIAANIKNVCEGGNQEIPPLIPPDFGEIEPHVGAFPPLIFS